MVLTNLILRATRIHILGYELHCNPSDSGTDYEGALRHNVGKECIADDSHDGRSFGSPVRR